MKNVVILGSSGQIGGELKRIFPQGIYPDRSQIDLANEASIDAYFSNKKTDLIVNCAAYTLVDKAESEETLALTINANALKNLARSASKVVHFSSDYVFNGQGFRPYVETDEISPVNTYGRTKAIGEEILLRENPNSVIIRTSWVYSDLGKNFVRTIAKLCAEKPELNVVFDQVGTPTYAYDLAKLILDHSILEDNLPPGIYHYSNEGVTSWYDFAREIASLTNLKCLINPILSKEYPTTAKRPHFSVLDKTKIKSTLGISIPHWRDSLKICLGKI